MRIPGVSTLGAAFSSLWERPLRTLLTMLGIIIGVAAVYAMLSIGEGAQKKILENLDSISARSMTVYPDWSRGRASRRRPWKPFNEADVENIREIPGVYAATGSLDSEYSLVTEYSDWSAEVKGIDTEYMKAEDATIDLGRAITAADIEQKRPIAVLGPSVVRSLFRGQNPVGERIKIQNIPFEIVGTTNKASGDNWRGQDVDNFVLVPRPTLRGRLMGDNRLVRNQVRGIKIVGETQGDLSRIETEIGFILRQSRNLSADEAPDYRIFNFSANRQAQAESQKTLSLLLATMGLVSLIVGGVGVMNIMLVSVTERTREIGLRMALGARSSDVMTQFLTEAVVLSILSGLLGLALGYGVSQFAGDMDNIEMIFSWRIAILSFGSALLIGVVFGFLPARQASKLNPIEALRRE